MSDYCSKCEADSLDVTDRLLELRANVAAIRLEVLDCIAADVALQRDQDRFTDPDEYEIHGIENSVWREEVRDRLQDLLTDVHRLQATVTHVRRTLKD